MTGYYIRTDEVKSTNIRILFDYTVANKEVLENIANGVYSGADIQECEIEFSSADPNMISVFKFRKTVRVGEAKKGTFSNNEDD